MMAFSLKEYRIIDEIGHGGFASIYRARQESLGREVAIKRLSPRQTQNTEEILRFRREAETMASLTHDNIIGIFDYTFHNGSYYIVMEYVEGMSLDTALEKRVHRGCALLALEKVACALKYAHANTVTHRDVKPANILLGRNGQVKLADFGLALFSPGMESAGAPGSVIGTINYMAPEALVSPKEVDRRVDIFSTGCILYQVLSGTLPFAGPSFGETSHRILNEEPQPLDSHNVPPALSEITMRCLQKERDHRPSMEEIHDVLNKTIQGRYHELREELISFVRGESGTKTDTITPAKPHAGAPWKRRLKQRVLAPIIAGCGACVLFLGGLVLFRSMFGADDARPSALPTLPAINSAVESESARNASPEAAIGRDGPAPIAGTSLDMKVGTLLLRGLAKEDTVLLNDAATIPARTGNEARLDVEPGYYNLIIKRNGRHLVTKKTEILPYQRLVVDVRDERKKQ